MIETECLSDKQLWHNRFGHLCIDSVKKLWKEELVDGMTLVNNDEKSEPICESCVMGKQHRNSLPKAATTQATEAYQTIRSDVCGPMPVESVAGSHYFVTFIDDFSRYTHVYFIKQKSEILQKFKEFVTLTTDINGSQMKTLVMQSKVKNLRSDNGGEYQSIRFDAYLKGKGTIHQTTVPDQHRMA